MKKALKKLKKKLTQIAVETPVVGNLVFKVADKLDRVEEKEEFEKRVINAPRTVQVQVNAKIEQAVKVLKDNMKKNRHLFGPGKHYGDEGFDLLGYTPGNNEKRAEIIKQTTDLSTKDVKTEEEKMEMIDKRIDHYKALQNDVVKRQLIRSIRHEKDAEKRQQMEAEFAKKYGAAR
jgi:hypothetical protein